MGLGVLGWGKERAQEVQEPQGGAQGPSRRPQQPGAPAAAGEHKEEVRSAVGALSSPEAPGPARCSPGVAEIQAGVRTGSHCP